MWYDRRLLSTTAVFSAFVLFASHDTLHWSKALESISPELARRLLGEIGMPVPRDRHTGTERLAWEIGMKISMPVPRDRRGIDTPVPTDRDGDGAGLCVFAGEFSEYFSERFSGHFPGYFSEYFCEYFAD
jgi:hypothetical protein